jgi:hypothetical protein
MALALVFEIDDAFGPGDAPKTKHRVAAAGSDEDSTDDASASSETRRTRGHG